jgi:diacylglycerol kinase family enzyme
MGDGMLADGMLADGTLADGTMSDGTLTYSDWQHRYVVRNEHAGSGKYPAELFEGFTPISLETLGKTLTEDDHPPPGHGRPHHHHGGTLVAAWGGDGTNRSVACLTAETDVWMLPCPGGTHNHFAKAVGLATVDDVAKALPQPASQLINVGMVNDELFLNNLSIGWYVGLVARRERYEQRMPRRLAKICSFVMQLGTIRRLRVTIDGQDERVWMVWVGNGRFVGEPGEIPHRTRLDEEVLDVRILRAGTTFPKMKALLAILSRRVESSTLIDQRSVATCTIEFRTPTIAVALDGEVLRLSAPLNVRSNQSLRVMIPS